MTARQLRFMLACALMVATVALGVKAAQALPRPCPPGYIWPENQGSCVKKKVTPQRSPAQRYYRGLNFINGTKTRAARPQLGLRLLRQACRQRHGAACTTIGFLYLNGRHVKASNERSLKFYSNGCKYRDSNGCIGAADIHSLGLLGKVDHAHAIPLLEAACKLKHGKGCYNLALKYWDSLGTKRNTKRARRLFKNAAGLLKDTCPSHGPSCHMLGVLYKTGRGVTLSYKRAFELFSAGCSARSGAACYELAGAYRRGRGTQSNIDKAKDLYHRACHAFDNASACHDAGALFVDGAIKPADRRRVTKYGERACQLDRRQCDVIAYLYGTGKGGVKDDKKAVKWYTVACNQGSRVSCYSVAVRHYYGSGTAKNVREAIRLYQRSCDHGHAAACTRLGRFYRSGVKGNAYALQPDAARAHRLFLVGCVRRNAEACRWAGHQLRWGETGRGTTKNPQRARIFYRRACNYSNGDACSALGGLLLHGIGGRKNTQRAKQYFVRGCKLKASTACQRLGGLLFLAKEESKAAIVYTKACRYGATEPCGWLDTLYKRSEATPKQRNTALRALESACNKRAPNEHACHSLGRLFAYGGYIAKPNPARAFQLFKEGCARKHQDSCVQLAHMYRRGIGVVRDANKAKQLFTTQCNGSAPASCAWLGVQLWQEKKYKLAVPLFKRACDEKSSVACTHLGFAHYTAQGTLWDVNAAQWAYARGCSFGLGVACTSMGALFEHGIGVKKNLVKALAHYRKGCSPVSSSGCTGVGRFHQGGLGGLDADVKKAETEYLRGCSEGGGDAIACRRLADIYRRSGGKPQRDVEMLYQKSLSLATQHASTSPSGKYVLAKMHLDGVAVVRNPAKALTLFEAACDGYDALGCYHAGKLLMGGAKLVPRYAAAAVRFARACATGLDGACARSNKARKLAIAPTKPATSKQVPIVPLQPKSKRGCACRSDGSSGGASSLMLLGVAVAVRLTRRRRKMNQ